MIVQNSAKYIKDTLNNIKGVAKELVIVDGGSTDNTVSICKEYTDLVFYRKFDGNFAEQKNFANSKCTSRWIFNIDSDELMSELLKSGLPKILLGNQGIDMIRIPRINKVKGITPELIKKWGYRIDDDGDISWPDYQDRLYKNRPGVIQWEMPVHEVVRGFRTFGNLPDDKSSGLYLLHIKDIEKQKQQNEFYSLYKYGIPNIELQ
jgi:glycosyltransferase involved in cell wall biosynthesis